MNIDHLHDALDHWKGSTIAACEEILHQVRVVPMLTDHDRWTVAHFQCYVALLRLPADRILLRNELFTNDGRNTYFASDALEGDFDLFLDPDTGIGTAGTCNHRHVSLDDVAILLPNGSPRLLMIYQHSQPYNMRDSIRDRMPRIRGQWPESFAIWAGAVSMVFISRRKERLINVRGHMAAWLGPCAENEHGNGLGRLLP